MAKPPLPKDAAPEPLPEFEPPPEGEELEHLLAEIAAYDEAMAGRDAEFAEELACRARSRGIDVSRMLPAIATDRDLLAEADHSIDVGGFAIGPEQVRDACRDAYLRGVEAGERKAGRVTTAPANAASTDTKKGNAAPGHARVLKLAPTAKGKSIRAKAQDVHDRMATPKLAVETIRKLLSKAQK